MEMMIAIIVLAAAATLSFMSFVTLKKQMEAVREESRAHWKSIEYSLEIQSNQISNEIQEGKTFNDNAFAALNENIITCKTEMVQEIKGHDVDSKERHIKILERSADSREVISANVDYIVKDYTGKVIAEINKSTRDINFITKQQAGRVITTPLKVMWEHPKVEAKSGN